ncbi:hypothetical protein N0V90_012277 [Kalmusia sp. IMI 367209]|nr:hypothetical protein N0V90_012277 [Kalmusia sp. IMI 367209]
MDIGHSSEDYELMGHPSDKLDAAWADLMQDFYTEVPYSYVESVGRLDEAIPSEEMFAVHCLQMILKAIMCKADTNPETLHWVDENQFPLGNRDSPHECINWSLLMDGMKKNRVDPFKPGVLVHPKYGESIGPVVPDGKNTIIDESEKHRFIINETVLHNPGAISKGR